jgi:hypothetical protein
MLDELVEDRLLGTNSEGSANIPLPGFIAMNKLIVWAKQVSL